MKKYLGFLRKKFTSANLDVASLIYSSYYRSMMIYYMTPLYAAGAVTEKELFDMEAEMKR